MDLLSHSSTHGSRKVHQEGSLLVHRISTSPIDIFLARDGQPGVAYSYGGTRLVRFGVSNPEVHKLLHRLLEDESGLKNHLINLALRAPIFRDDVRRLLPAGVLGSTVGGARCLLRPRSPDAQRVLENPEHPEFEATLRDAFKPLGDRLNELGGTIKLTPDFGRYAKVSDWLANFTPHVLGIRCQGGGCGGKSSYSATGIVASLEATFPFPTPVTVIGADGALGREVVAYLQHCHVNALAVCDLAYDRGVSQPPSGCTPLAAREGMFTTPCLRRGGTIIATTVGCELEHSDWAAMPVGTLLVLAHNLAVPRGQPGIRLMRALAAHGILALPGQPLTLGGALTSRLEWYYRQANPGKPFGPEMKALAHEVVRSVCRFLATETLTVAHREDLTPFEAMFVLAGSAPRSRQQGKLTQESEVHLGT